MTLPRMYTEFARYWPLVSTREEYALEASYWRDALRQKLGPGRHEILELGVGGGHNLSYLTSEFKATAADISPEMVKQAKLINPDVEFHVGDMRTIRLGRKFKAVLIHDAISYMLSEDDLRAAFATAAAHLEPGGVFITAPESFRETFHSPCASAKTNSDGHTAFTLIEYEHDPDPADTTTESLMWYLIEKDGSLRIEQDLHITGLFGLKTWLRLMEEAGFEVETLPYDIHKDHPESYLLVGTAKTAHP